MMRLVMNKFIYDKKDIISLFMSMQKLAENLSLTFAEQKNELKQVNQNMNLSLEQLNIAKHKQFGRSSEKWLMMDNWKCPSMKLKSSLLTNTL